MSVINLSIYFAYVLFYRYLFSLLLTHGPKMYFYIYLSVYLCPFWASVVEHKATMLKQWLHI